MLQKFENHLSENLSFLKGKKLLLAVSGGLDSMTMAELLGISGCKIYLAHCNFNLREKESEEDAFFVKLYAERNKLKLFSTSFDTKAFASDSKLSIQVAARQLRYIWFLELLVENDLDYVLTAHHADDNLETFLINFNRGTGLEGLTGIPQQNGKIIRPLLPFSRQQIEKYAQEHDVAWREDSSNASDKYMRNQIRHDIVPAFKAHNDNFLNSFVDTLSHLQQAQSMVNDAAAFVYKEVVIEKDDKLIFKIFDLKRLPNYRAYLHHWLRDFGFTAWNDIYSLVDAQSGKQIFSEEFVLLKDREILILSRISKVKNQSYFIEKSVAGIEHPLNLLFCNVADISDVSNDCIFVDKDKLKFPLELRSWNEGDYFFPFGMEGKKKVSKFFKDEKFSLIDKSGSWLLCSQDQIVWIVGKRLDDRFKVTDKTKNILQIKTA